MDLRCFPFRVELEVDVLVGVDYLWLFQNGRVLRGKPNEPVAIETELGWVLSGCVDLGSVEADERFEVKLVRTENCGSRLDHLTTKFWDLESIGIRADEDENESVIRALRFNG